MASLDRAPKAMQGASTREILTFIRSYTEKLDATELRDLADHLHAVANRRMKASGSWSPHQLEIGASEVWL